MAKARLYGADYSVYVRIARLVLAECEQDYDLVAFDVFDQDAVPDDYDQLHPFGKIPAFEHDGFRLFETDAIAHYVNEAFGNGDLMPYGPRPRARCLQIMRIVDNYAYRSLVWDIFVAETDDKATGAKALSEERRRAAERVLGALEGLCQEPYLCGRRLSLADLWLAPVYAYFRLAPSGPGLLAGYPKLLAWWQSMAERPSLRDSRYPEEQQS